MDKTPLICDYGSGFSKVGFAGTQAPQAVFPTILGKMKHTVSSPWLHPPASSAALAVTVIAPTALTSILPAPCQMAQEGGLSDRGEGMCRPLPSQLQPLPYPPARAAASGCSFSLSLVPLPLAIQLGSQLEPLATFSSHFRDPFSELDWQCPSTKIVTPALSF